MPPANQTPSPRPTSDRDQALLLLLALVVTQVFILWTILPVGSWYTLLPFLAIDWIVGAIGLVAWAIGAIKHPQVIPTLMLAALPLLYVAVLVAGFVEFMMYGDYPPFGATIV